jgi:hypothetical protein
MCREERQILINEFIFIGILKEGDHLGDLDVNERMIVGSWRSRV